MNGIEIRFSYLSSPLAAAGLFALAALAAALVYRRSFRARPRWVPWALAALRFASISTALLLILRPVASYDRFERKDSRIVVLVDRSRSMAAQDSIGGEPRIASALRVAASASVEKLGRLFRLERYAFSGPRSLAAWSPALAADGATTDIASAFRDLPPGPALEAAILISDGRDHSGAFATSGELPPGSLPAAPVYAVGLGSGGAEVLDAAWEHAACERHVLRGSRVSVRGSIRLRGAESIQARISARLGGNTVASRELRLSRGANPVALEIAPDRGGTFVYELAIELPSRDAIPENDSTHIVLEVEDKPLQVLYLEGRLRPQYKFVRSALERDPRLNVTGVVALASGRRLEQGRPPIELRDGFPPSREAMRAFGVAILGNVVLEDLPPEAPGILVRWVDEDGGGLILSGGLESLPGLAATEIDEILPISVARAERLPGDLLIRVPLAASGHPVVRGLGSYFSPERPGGPFLLPEALRAGRLRPGAEALLAVTPWRPPPEAGESEKSLAPPPGPAEILLASRSYGRGRVLLYLTESDWRWRTERAAEGGERLLETIWSRMVRWAGKREEERGEIRVRLEREVVRAGETVKFEIEAQPGSGAPAVTLELPGGARRALELEPAPDGPGVWRGKILPEAPGVYRLAVVGAEGASSSAVLVAEPDAREIEDVSPDWGLLRRIAAATGGRFFTLAEASAIGDAIAREARAKIERVEVGIERSWTAFAILVLLLSAEWILRRRIHVI